MASLHCHPWPVAPAAIAFVAAGTTFLVGLEIADSRGLGVAALFGVAALSAQIGWIVSAAVSALLGASGTFDIDHLDEEDDGHLLVSEGAFFAGTAENGDVQDFSLPAFPEPTIAVVMPLRAV